MLIITYNTLEERSNIIAAQEAAGLIMAHDEIRNGQPTMVWITAAEHDALQPPPESFVPDANYAAATTTDEKLDVIARRLGLIE